MNRRKFLVGLAAATAMPTVPFDDGLVFPLVRTWPSAAMIEAVTPLTQPGLTITMELIEYTTANIVAAFGMRAEYLR